jgi:hypothetical protein
MVLADGAGAPLGVHVEAASPAEVTLLPHTLNSLADNVEEAHLQGWPQRLIADRAYDSNVARQLLRECEIFAAFGKAPRVFSIKSGSLPPPERSSVRMVF